MLLMWPPDTGIHNNQIFVHGPGDTCGPVALLNTLLYLRGPEGVHTNREALIDATNARPGVGVDNDDLTRVIPTLGLKIEQVEHEAHINDMCAALTRKKRAAILVNYFNAFHSKGHYSVVVEHDTGTLFLLDSVFGLLRFRKEYFEKWWFSGDGKSRRWYCAVTDETGSE